MNFSLDSNCMISCMSEDHDFHAASFAAFLKIHEESNRLILSAHSRLESLSTVTRMPLPLRVDLEAALASWTALFGKATIVTPSEEDYDNAIQTCRRANIAGGVLYDALIAQTVHRHGATKLLSWNTKHMKLVAPAGLEVLRPDMVLI